MMAPCEINLDFNARSVTPQNHGQNSGILVGKKMSDLLNTAESGLENLAGGAIVQLDLLDVRTMFDLVESWRKFWVRRC